VNNVLTHNNPRVAVDTIKTPYRPKKFATKNKKKITKTNKTEKNVKILKIFDQKNKIGDILRKPPTHFVKPHSKNNWICVMVILLKNFRNS
jgi:hypothetical protein